ncbi:MAG: multidrug effflux MFS transporter [Pseudomonadota bacterium]
MARLDPVTQERPLLVLLTLMLMLGPFSVDAYLPVMPEIARDLQASDAVIQFTIGGFLIGTAISPLVAGPLSDALGRRGLILFGLGIFALCAAGGAMAASGEALVVWRMLQSLAGASALVAGMAMMADLYEPDTLARRTSLVMVFVSIAPLIAPVFGAWIAGLSGWRMIFWLIAAASILITAASVLRLPETLPADRREALQPGPLARGYLSVLSNRNAVFYMLGAMGMSSAFFTFLAGAPFLYINHLGLTPGQFAWIFGAGAGLAILGNMVNIRMVARFGFRYTLVIQGVAMIGLGALFFAGCFGVLGTWAIFTAGLLIMPAQHLMSANTLAGVLAQFDRRKGMATAVAMSTRFSCGAIAVWVMGAYGEGVEQFGLILFACLALSGIFAQLAVRREVF